MLMYARSNIRYFFFFQAEDGIRDSSVTGVQTCALPIYPGGSNPGGGNRNASAARQRTYQNRTLPNKGPNFQPVRTGSTSGVPMVSITPPPRPVNASSTPPSWLSPEDEVVWQDAGMVWQNGNFVDKDSI